MNFKTKRGILICCDSKDIIKHCIKINKNYKKFRKKFTENQTLKEKILTGSQNLWQNSYTKKRVGRESWEMRTEKM